MFFYGVFKLVIDSIRNNNFQFHTQNSQIENNHIDDKEVWRKIDDVFDFGAGDKLNYRSLSETELEQYLTIISKLLKKGIIGWKYYEINGQIEKHFVETSIGDQRLAKAVPVKWNKVDKYY